MKEADGASSYDGTKKMCVTEKMILILTACREAAPLLLGESLKPKTKMYYYTHHMCFLSKKTVDI